MRKQFGFVILTIAVAATLIFFFYKSASTQKPETDTGRTAAKPELTDVIVNQAFEHPLYIGLYVAYEAGFFEQEGLNVKIETGGGDSQAFAALTSNAAHFAQGDPAFVAIGNQQGWQGRVVAMAVDRVAMWGVTFDDTIEPFTDPANFAGKKIATYPEPNTSYVVQKQLALRAGLKLGEDTEIIQVPFGTELATLRNKQADIAHTIEPNVSQVEAEGGRVVFAYPEAWGPLAFTGVMTSKKTIDEEPALVQSFINAYERGLRLVHSDFNQTVEIAATRLPDINRSILSSAIKRLIDSESIPRHAAVDPVSWRKLLEIRVEVGDLAEMPEIDLIDNRFADKAAAASVGSDLTTTD